jgi:Zn-dependent peptidase ImmA (M78 family)/transcriptional regulator with XRE-family HTH domain
VSEISKVFGAVTATDRETAARESTRKFIRSKAEIGLLREGKEPPGHIMTAWEAYHSYGFDILDEAIEYGSAILLESVGAVERTFKTRRNDLGLSIESVAGASHVDAGVVKQAEKLAHDIPVKVLEKLAFALGLDERLLSFSEKDVGDKSLAFRLKTLQQTDMGNSHLSAGVVLQFAEVASVVRIQSMLMDWLDQPSEANAFQPDPNYGSLVSPAWRLGYRLASKARNRLGLGSGPISSMRDLVEKRLGIPVVQVRLPQAIAGATITTSGHDGSDVRGVVLNTVGDNANVWVRRATLAHELGHILYDPDTELERLRVDSYTGIQENPEIGGERDYVEQRANAFAIAFLAPLESVREIALSPISTEAVGKVMQTFGISWTAARYHVSNAHYRTTSLSQSMAQLDPSDEWRIAEESTLDYFPVGSSPYQRRGRFAGLVAECHQRRMLSSQTAALYLGCTEQEFVDNESSIRELHPV